jgi:hypothetical protein
MYRKSCQLRVCPGQGSVKCINMSQICDGNKDCSNGMDENNCLDVTRNKGEQIITAPSNKTKTEIRCSVIKEMMPYTCLNREGVHISGGWFTPYAQGSEFCDHHKMPWRQIMWARRGISFGHCLPLLLYLQISIALNSFIWLPDLSTYQPSMRAEFMYLHDLNDPDLCNGHPDCEFGIDESVNLCMRLTVCSTSNMQNYFYKILE